MLFNYTDTLQNIFESYPVNRDEHLTNKQVIENARPLLFDFDYPIFDENYKSVFETQFIRNFYIRQIGFDSYGLFKFQLETWLNVHMPYFNKLFESELLNYDPLINFDVKEKDNRITDRKQDDTKTNTANRNTEVDSTINKDQVVTGVSTETGNTTGEASTVSETHTDGTSNSTGSGTTNTDSTKEANSNVNQNNFNRKLGSETPQNRLAITTNDGEGVIEYASNIEENKDKNNQVTTSTGGENVDQTTSETRQETSGVDSSATSNDTSKVNTTSTGNTTSNDTSMVTSAESTLQNENKTDVLASNVKTIDDYISSKVGKVGSQSYASMVMEYRGALLRIQRDIFKEMNELFMLVY